MHHRRAANRQPFCVKRILGEMKDYLSAPISNKRGAGYFYDRDIDAQEMDRRLTRSYGIFGGEATATARLHFTAKAARWAADEAWFPNQQGDWLEDGSYELSIPYGDATELMMDICRYGPEVEVIAPDSLRLAVAERLLLAAKQYDSIIRRAR